MLARWLLLRRLYYSVKGQVKESIGLEDLGPGQARNIDEIGDIAGCRGSSQQSSATVWQVDMTEAEYLAGFESLTRRLLSDVAPKSSRAVFREVDLAQKALDHSHDKVVEHHLDRALAEIADLEQSGQLASEWAASLRKIGQWITERL